MEQDLNGQRNGGTGKRVGCLFSTLTYCLLRGVAQLVRRVLWEHEIVGSSPATPTNSSLFLVKNDF